MLMPFSRTYNNNMLLKASLKFVGQIWTVMQVRFFLAILLFVVSTGEHQGRSYPIIRRAEPA
jgi:hypothetical protein